jgi:hypothetical protein
MFESTSVSTVKVKLCYVNSKRQLEAVQTTTVDLNSNNELEKEKLVSLIGINKHYKQKQYNLHDLLKYDVNFQTHEDCCLDDKSNFVSRGWKYSNDISWTKSILFFHELNELVLLFKEQNHNHKQKTTAATKKNQQMIKKRKPTTHKMKIIELNNP